MKKMIICIKMGTSREIQKCYLKVCISIGTVYFLLFSMKWGVFACLTDTGGLRLTGPD